MKALNTKILLDYMAEGNKNNADLYFDSDPETEFYFLNNLVLHEVVTHLEENVKFDKLDILTVLRALVLNSQIRFENREILLDAIETYSRSKDSFSECLKSVINTGFTMNYFANYQKGKVNCRT